ncbi:Hypothetical protein CAP_0767 [Chondromyces apiculatus DSM 436]|uniref:Uncharacterized protein n=1 Tax=Chondromyces apiculatus DSM 436 TaxID=1192034 RepID=A0A017TDB2_9BACT|nr:Hypothetical protein CAP_0767 [Chondromyces apiculatus DSM 436]
MNLLFTAGCGGEAPRDTAEGVDMQAFAYRYLHEEVDDATSQRIMQQIRAFSPDEYNEFQDALRELQPQVDDGLDWLVDELRYEADLRGMKTIDLTHADAPEVMTAIKARRALAQPAQDSLACGPLQVSCQSVKFGGHAPGGSCGWGCVSASGSDRTSNSPCEDFACDHRIWFNGLSQVVDGKTAAADCVILHYGGFASRYANGRTEVVVGVEGPLVCGILFDVTGVLQRELQVW